MKVLIVDDDPNLRGLYAAAFTAAGHGVRVVPDAASGEQALGADSYDALVIDVRLGRDHGIDVAREVARLGLSTRIVVICGTGDFTRAEIFDLAPGVAAVLRKPVDIETLVGEVAAAVAGDLPALRANGRLPRA